MRPRSLTGDQGLLALALGAMCIGLATIFVMAMVGT
jgi:hypothetical protein